MRNGVTMVVLVVEIECKGLREGSELAMLMLMPVVVMIVWDGRGQSLV
jgi:hypothetical protein